MAAPKGHPRYGGRAKGTLNKATLSKNEAKEAARAVIAKHFERMTRAQIEAAIGLLHFFARDAEGKFERITDPSRIEELLNAGDENAYYISQRDPNVQAFNTLAAYYLDKPQEPPQEVNLNVTEIGSRLDAARLTAAARNRKKGNE